ncbi:FliH/SctL family protein [Iodidimonas sp. SYSU 1G8]|uniref:FliH/SctL family protein n=1 Tax=Iodidimonas sp. SYSU 1G8 TaxID=3133967 RepID=UPI0031FED94E
MNIVSRIEQFDFGRVFTGLPELPGAPDGCDRDLTRQLLDLQSELERLRSDHRAELAVVRAEAFQAGLDQARRETEMATLQAVDAVQAELEQMAGAQEAVTAALTRDAAELALVAADVLAGWALDVRPAEAIEQAVSRIIGREARGRRIEIRVHPDLVAPIRERLAAEPADGAEQTRLVVLADAALSRGDARVSWDLGGLVLDAAARRDAILAELAPVLDPPRDSDAAIVTSLAARRAA